MITKVSIFEFIDYKEFINATLSAMESGGRGEISKIAKLLTLNKSFVSQVLSGVRSFSREHAFILGEHFGLDDLELRYFKELIDLDRSNNPSYKNSIKKELEKIKAEAKLKSGQSPLDQPLDERSQAVFYSEWKYSAVQLVTALPNLHTPSAIAKKLGIDEKNVKEILNFLVSCGLCKRDGDRYEVGTRKTSLAQKSPNRPRHHSNWRMRAGDAMTGYQEEDFFFTGPMCVDQKTYDFIGKSVRELVKEVKKRVDEAENETVACLNIDWFKF